MYDYEWDDENTCIRNFYEVLCKECHISMSYDALMFYGLQCMHTMHIWSVRIVLWCQISISYNPLMPCFVPLEILVQDNESWLVVIIFANVWSDAMRHVLYLLVALSIVWSWRNVSVHIMNSCFFVQLSITGCNAKGVTLHMRSNILKKD